MKKLKPLNISLMDAVKLACRGGLSKGTKLRVADRIEKSNAFPNWVKRLREEAGVIKNENL